jgi:hypothetical protein
MMPIQDANFYLDLLENNESVIFGKLIITKEGRLVGILLLAIPILKELSKP